VFYKLTCLIDFLAYLCIQIQEKLPYHIENVKSNDSLFAESEFKNEIFKKITEIIQEISTTQNELDFHSPDILVIFSPHLKCFYDKIIRLI